MTLEAQEDSVIDLSTDRGIQAGKNLAQATPGEEVVITGISGLYPESENVYAFRHNLFNKVDMVTSENKRWDMIHPDIPERSGKIPNINKFDAGFFGVHDKEANIMDPMSRLVLERVIESIYDAGVHPSELEGTRTGVYLSTINTDCQSMLFKDDLGSQNFAVTGISRFMIPHRIAYHLKLNGPAYILDTACSSSMYAFENAYKAIRKGEIDAAIVAAATIILHPATTLQFARLGVLSPDGASKTFDDSANGYARAETVSAIFLQKLKNSRRVYAKLVHVFTNCDGYKEQGITHPSTDQQMAMLEEFYKQCELDPLSVDFVEAHGTGTRAGDAEEIIPIDSMFCKNRDGPLYLGSVKSNMGHPEPSAALCQIAKALIIMDTELIPPNLHYNKPRQGVEALESGRIKVVTEVTPFRAKKGRISISSFGFGGANGHCVLQWNEKKKKVNGLPEDDLPRLVCLSGRTPQALTSLMSDLRNRTLDAEYVALLHNIFRYNTPSHTYRGYTIVSKKGEILSSQRSYNQQKSDFCLVFGDASQDFANVSKELLQLPIFSNIINRIEKILSPKGMNIQDTLSKKKESTLQKAVTSVVMQIGIFEVLKALEIVPSSILAVSYGTFAKAYANGTFSLEQAVLSAYHIIKLVSCVPKADTSKTVVKTGKTNFESIINNIKNYKLSDLAPDMLDYAPYKQKNVEYATPEYFMQNLLHPEDVLQNVPSDSVIIKIGNIKTASEQRESSAISLKPNGIVPLLQTIGSLYELGWNPDLQKLYPLVDFPVSRGTRMISPLIKWKHDKDWFVISYSNRDQIKTYDRAVAIDLKENDWSYVAGHVIDGRNLFPATGYLFIVWEALSMMHGKMFMDMKVVFENIKFMRATTLSKDTKIEFVVSIRKSNGHFEILESGVVVVTGKIHTAEDVLVEHVESTVDGVYDNVILQRKEAYKELRLRGYNYSGLFQGIEQYDASRSVSWIQWKKNWVAFMDNMLQTQILHANTRSLYIPTYIQRITIDALHHMLYCKDLDVVPIQYCSSSNVIKSGGIEIRGLNASAIARRKPLGQPVLEKYVFVPNEAKLSTEESVRVNVQIALENNYRLKVKVLELLDKEKNELLGPIIFEVLGDQPLIHADVTVLTEKPLEVENVNVQNKSLANESDALVVVVTSGLSRPEILDDAFKCTVENGYVLSRELISCNPVNVQAGIEVLTVHSTPSEKLVLLTKTQQRNPFKIIDVTDTFGLDWLRPLQDVTKENEHNDVLVVSRNNPTSGILGLVNCIRREPGGDRTKCIFLQDDAPEFNPSHELYKRQLSKGLAINVFKNGKWGTYRHLLLDKTVEDARENCFVNVMTRGDLSSLKWIEGPVGTREDPESNNELVDVYYSALNFKDIMTATGRLQSNISTGQKEQECIQGLEYSGRDSTGRRVMGFCSGGALATRVITDRRILIPVPDAWSLEDAATVPIVYGTVLYALVVRGNLKRGQSVLIHAGSGGIGQAAINVCLHYGCNIFTTVGTKEKREFIIECFPEIQKSHIGNSRDTSFEQLVYKQTKGRGVDIVLNSLAEEKLQTSLRCLSKRGKFLEIGKFDLESENSLHLELFRREASFHGVYLDYFFNTDITKTLLIIDLIKEGIKDGSVKPLVRTYFKEHEIESAFRFMAAGKHIGKVLINIRPEERNACVQTPIKRINAIPRYYCDPQSSYVIIGGLGGFGLELANWLVQRGARKLVLASRNGIKTGYQALRIKAWKSEGSTVAICTAPVQTRDGCKTLLEQAASLGPVAAIFNLAVLLLDAMFENQTTENFVNSLEPKASATILLDDLSRQVCPALRDFVVFSSVSCGRGNAGQTNYGMANSVMERICERRREQGLPGLAIQWGAVGDVGLVAEMQDEDKVLEIGGTLQQGISSCLGVMDQFLRQSEPVVSSIVVAEKRTALGSADNVVDCVANIIGVRDMKTISLHSTLPELGMDSMMASEIKQILEREFDIFLTPEGVRSLTFAKLHQIMSEKETAKLEVSSKVAVEESEAPQVVEKTDSSVQEHLVKMASPKVSPTGLVILFPGLEGDLSLMETIAKNLDVEVWGTQYYVKVQYTSVEEAASQLLPDVQKLVRHAGRFQLVGHSFGCLVALEIAAVLEKEGLLGTIILIDGAPKSSVEFTRQLLGILKGSQMENKILQRIVSNMLPAKEAYDIMGDIARCANLDEKLDTLAQLLARLKNREFEYVRSRIYGIYMRTFTIMEYKPSYGKIKSTVKLFRPTEFIRIAQTEKDYGLSELVEAPVQVDFFDGNHISVLKNLSLSEAINDLVY